MSQKRGFTLIELMASMTIFLVLVLLIVELVNLTGQAIRQSNRRLDAVSQARAALDRLSVDLAAYPRHKQTYFFVTKIAGNDELSFYSEVPSYSGTRRVSLVSYRIQTDAATGKLRLERGTAGSDWDVTKAPLNITAEIPINADDFVSMGDGVFRMEVNFVKKSDGTLVKTDPLFNDRGALVVTLAAMDPEVLKIVDKNQLKNLSDGLTDALDGVSTLDTWTTLLGTATYLNLAPRPASASIRVFQRTIALNR